MIVDLRIYDCKPGMMPAWVKLYEEFAWPLQKQHLGNCLGWYTSVEGKLHRVVHIWGYESQAERETKRAALAKDPKWHEFVMKANEMGAFVEQNNSIMSPAAFYTPK